MKPILLNDLFRRFYLLAPRCIASAHASFTRALYSLSLPHSQSLFLSLSCYYKSARTRWHCCRCGERTENSTNDLLFSCHRYKNSC